MGRLATSRYSWSGFNCWLREYGHKGLCLFNNQHHSQWGILSNTPIAVPPFALSAKGCSEPLGSEQSVSWLL
jgi:hypothetical protein